MSVDSAFDEYQATVNADVEQVGRARERRDLFREAFEAEPDVVEVIPSGSLARGTQKDPIHDVDVIIVYDFAAHPEWGSSASSAEAALNHVQTRVGALLEGDGTHEAGAVRYTMWRNHAVKCWLDPTDHPKPFTVDAMPALRSPDGTLLIPEFLSDSWVPCNPEFLIAAVADKHAEWNKFAGSVRMLKAWASEQTVDIKSLVMEVLALELMPIGKRRPTALNAFFVRAANYVESGYVIEDPAKLCGPIQPDLDMVGFADLLRDAATVSSKAQAAEQNNNHAGAIKHWGEVFGDAFPLPPAGTPAVITTAPRTVRDNPQG